MRDTLVDLLQAAGEKVVAERPGSHRQVTEFMALEGRSLKKNPDLITAQTIGRKEEMARWWCVLMGTLPMSTLESHTHVYS